MKWIVFILILSFPLITGWAQTNLTQAEYFFDLDPGMGGGLPIAGITSSTTIDVNDIIDVSGLSIGMHTLGIRIMDDNNVWSMSEYIPVFVTLASANMVADLTAAEYFFDTDPGIGAGNSITLAATQNIDINDMFPTSALSLGMHTLNIRIRNEFNEWSMVETVPVFVTRASALVIEDIDQVEYFFDTDPGIGLATPLVITAAQNIDINDIIPTGALSTGMHVLNIRIRTTNAEWSLAESMPVFLNQDNLITQLEYFVDTDPGIGLATPVTIASTQNPLAQQFIVPTSTLSLGDHKIFARVKNDIELWSLTDSASFLICDGANAAFSADTVRIGNPTNFTDESLNALGTDTYSWDFENDGTVDDTTVGSTSFSYSLAGLYDATLVIDRAGCSDTSLVVEILVLDAGVAVINGEDNSGPILLVNQEVDLGSTVINVDIDKIFVIDNQSTTNTLAINSIISDNTVFEVINVPTAVAPLSFEQFTVRLTAGTIGVFSGNVSVSTDAGDFTFAVIGEVVADALNPDLSIYNVVTPNGDGVHDFFKIGNIAAFLENEVIIYNRWGDKVFEMTGYNNLNRTFVGIANIGSDIELDTGNYYYSIDRGDGSKRETGYLFLKR